MCVRYSVCECVGLFDGVYVEMAKMKNEDDKNVEVVKNNVTVVETNDDDDDDETAVPDETGGLVETGKDEEKVDG